MHIAVMGTGGLGGYVGARLAQAGLKVTFIARGRQLQAMQQHGLHVHTPEGHIHIDRPAVTGAPAAVGPVDVVLFCVKAYDAPSAADAILPMIAEHTIVLPLLNGVDHCRTLAAAVGAHHVVGGAALIVSHRIAPGVVEQISMHRGLTFGELTGDMTPRCERLGQALAVDGIRPNVVPNIVEKMWEKLALVCGSGIFSVTRGNKGAVWQTADIRELASRAVAEVVAVAHAQRIPLDDALPERYLALVESVPAEYKPSMLVDLEQGHRLEVQALNGAVARIGAERGVPTPVNAFIYACLQPYMHGTASKAA